MWKTIKRFKWLIILIVVLAVAAIIWISTQKTRQKPDLETEKLERGTIVSTVNTTGTLNAVISVDIGCQVSGRITKIFVDYNSPVKKGQLLAQVDPLVYRAQVDEANANLDSARASNANYQAQYMNALSKIKESQASCKNAAAQVEVCRANLAGAVNSQKSAKASLEKAKAQLINDQVEFRRSEELMKKELVSRSDLDAAETKYKVSLASVDVARATFDQAASSVKSSQMQLDAARATLESAKIAEESQRAVSKATQAQVRQSAAQITYCTCKLQEAMINLSYTDIHSPIDGIVVSRAVDAGQTVAASFSAPKLFTLAKDLTDMEVYASVDEADIGKVKQNMKVSYTVDAFQNETFSGVVRQVRKASSTDQGVVKYQVMISTKNPDLKLMPGMTANVVITSEVRDDCLKIPNSAIRFKPESVKNFPTPAPPAADGKGKNGRNGHNGNNGGKTGKVHGEENTSTVWVLDGPDRVHPERIEGGITDGRYTEMKKGNLKEGDAVITGSASAKKSARATVRVGMPGGGPPPR